MVRLTDGGAIYVLKTYNITVTESTFDQNYAYSNGGALFIKDALNTKMTSSSF